MIKYLHVVKIIKIKLSFRIIRISKNVPREAANLFATQKCLAVTFARVSVTIIIFQ